MISVRQSPSRAKGKPGPAIILMALIAVAAAHAQKWSDRSEYDIVLAVRSEAIPAKRLELLEQWKQKFPKSELQQVRAELQLSAYEALGDTANMLKIAQEMIAKDPANFVGLYWLTVLSPSLSDASTQMLTQAGAAASKLITEIPNFFSPEKKPAGTEGSDWQNLRTQAEIQARRTSGWVQWQRGAYSAAETEFRAVLRLDPKQLEISSWLGVVLALQKTPEKQLEAIWHLGRATYVDSGSSFTATQRTEARLLLERVYGNYHGGLDGLDQIGMAAMAAVMPPADFRVETAEEAAVRKREEELSRTNPELLTWIRIRRQLEGPDVQKNFEALTASVTKLKGFVVRHTPAKSPTELVIALQDPAVEELVLKLDSPLPGSAEPGTPIEFEAKPVSFKSEPFLLYAEGEKEKVTGWPTPSK
jgi:tetratricopeptide (TPR) repeat protein